MGKRIVSKILLFAMNIVYFLAAVAVLTIGCLSLTGSPAILDILNLIESTALLEQILDVQALTVAASIYLVTLGSLAIALSFIGSCASFKDGGWILVFFGVSKVVIILFNLGLIMYNSIVPYHGQVSVQNLLLDNLRSNYRPTKTDGVSVMLPNTSSSAYYWAEMEFTQACCAAESYKDYVEVLYRWEVITNVTSNENISSTCCMQIKQYQVPKTPSDFVNLAGCLESAPNYANPKGCIGYVMTIILNYRQVYILVAASFIALEVILISLTIRVHGERDRKVGIF